MKQRPNRRERRKGTSRQTMRAKHLVCTTLLSWLIYISSVGFSPGWYVDQLFRSFSLFTTVIKPIYLGKLVRWWCPSDPGSQQLTVWRISCHDRSQFYSFSQ